VSATAYEDNHCIALARELTYAADVPLRDRYGFASGNDDVLALLAIVFREPDDAKAAIALGLAPYVDNECCFAEGYDTPASDEYIEGIVRAVRPLIEQRRSAAARSLR
jgi:hypothetical protein